VRQVRQAVSGTDQWGHIVWKMTIVFMNEPIFFQKFNSGSADIRLFSNHLIKQRQTQRQNTHKFTNTHTQTQRQKQTWGNSKGRLNFIQKFFLNHLIKQTRQTQRQKQTSK
jgi:hypothetical protein